MDFNELFSILQNGDETDRIEAKKAANGVGKSFLETVSALSNEPDLGGGYILLGITKNDENEPKYIITGVSDPDTLQNEIAGLCRQCFNVPLRPTLKVIPHSQGNILLVYIPEANAHEKPVYIKNKGLEKGAYRRIGSSDQICTREDLDLLYQLRSKRKYDETPEERASLEDFDPKALEAYRFERKRVKADAPELRYNDNDLLKSLQATLTEKGCTLPTIGGLLLFGTQMVMRRLFSLTNRVDYMLVEGREWVGDSDRRYTALELCESLMTGIPRLLNQIMNDIPQIFALEDNDMQRKDNPLIPRKVIREAVVNALMHKDYRISSPVQIIKYANRIEFRNMGYSLKPKEQLGLPGSICRNDILSNVFHDIHYAEAKGTGIGTMREEMKKANLSVPLIESNRAHNLFILTLLPHHLFNKKDIEWLRHFKACSLTDEEARTLIIVREMGAITNADYRTINAVDTLTASFHLRRLRGFGLLEQKGSGSATYYIPTRKFLNPDTSALPGGLQAVTGGVEAVTGGVEAVTGGVEAVTGGVTLLQNLKKEIGLKKRRSPDEIKALIRRLCAMQPLKLGEIAALLGRSPKHIRDTYLTPMMKAGELEHTFPETPAHPLQAYKTKKLELADTQIKK
jgi:ATP-dependent DNA helicase RecG